MPEPTESSPIDPAALPVRPETPPQQAQSVAPRARVSLLRHGWRLLLAGSIGAPMAAAVAVVATLHSATGSAWLLSGLPGVQVDEPRGALLGPDFSAQRVRIRLPREMGELDVRELRWQGAQWRWWLREGVWVGVQVEELSASAVRFRSGAPTAQPLKAPTDLRLPLQLSLQRLAVDSLSIDEAPPITGLSAAMHLGDEGGSLHRLANLQLRWDRLEARGFAQIRADAEMPLEAALELQQAGPSPEWKAQLRAAGPLAAPQLSARLAATRGAIASTELDAQAEVRPFAAWPLGDVDLRMRTLDLASLYSRWPRTRLSGTARVHTTGLDKPVGIELGLDNALPGPWDRGALPLRQARVELSAARGQEAVDIRRLDLDVGPAAASAGQWRGSGQWSADGLKLKSLLSEVRLRALDTRLPAMSLSGPVQLDLSGLPVPPTQPGASPASAAASRSIGVAVGGELRGRLEAQGPELSLSLQAAFSSGRVEVRRLAARAGQAQAELRLRAERSPARAWSVQSEGRLSDFDPGPWWVGPPDAAWRQGPHRLNAHWSLQVGLAHASADPLSLQALQGSGRIELEESVLAGVKVSGRIHLAQELATAAAPRLAVDADMSAGRNRIRLQGRGDLASSGAADQWSAEVEAPRLEDLGPWARLHPDLKAWKPEAGRARVRFEAYGRWPQMRTQGEAEIERIKLGAATARSGQARWAVDSQASSPLLIEGELGELAWQGYRLASLKGQVQGSWREHRATLEMAAPLMPPGALESLLGVAPGAGTQARVSLDGSWQPLPDGAHRWSGKVHQFSLGVWNGQTPVKPAAEGATWIEGSNLRGELDFAGDGRLLRAQALPGSARLLSALNVRWEALGWSDAAATPEFEMRASVAPFALLPWLKRMSPGAAWAGELKLAARLDLYSRAGKGLQADAWIGRHDGDLLLQDGGGSLAFGLSEAELGLSAANGRWVLSPKVTGRNLGTMGGAVVLQIPPQALWPDTSARLDGALRVAVADLGVWTSWLPPGWRVQGALESTARLSGQLGAPSLTGTLVAQRVGLRNLLQGVAFSDGELRVALEGETARVESFNVRAGEGTISVSGEALLGARPEARLATVAQKARLLGRIDRQLTLSGQSRLLLRPDRADLSGQVTVDTGLFDLSSQDAPALDEDVRVRTAAVPSAPLDRPAAPAPSPLMRASRVALDLDLGEKLRVKGRGLDSMLRGSVRLSTPAGRLAANGIVRTVGGTYAAYGQKLQIERGVLEFTGPLDQPRLDILALRPNTDVRVGVAITGTAETPRVRLYSEPELGETDKLSWLVLGRGSEGLGRTDATVLQRAAVALLAGESEAPTDALLRAFQIDDLAIRQSDGELRETVVSLGKQLSRNWYVGYERSVNATTGNWQLIYRLAQRFTLRAQSGLDNALDLIWTWRFDEARMPKSSTGPP